MGSCISSTSRSKVDLNDVNSNIYRVVNIDDNGVPLWSGQLGISRTEIILFRKGLPPTRWPLRCLRRYGYDTDLFSFEVGRRCVTGEGIYAFRCRHAENLFQTLQSYIQMSLIGDDNNGINLSNTNSLIGRADAPSPMSTLSGQNSTPNNTMIGTYILPNPRTSNAIRLSPSVTGDGQHPQSYDAFDTNYLEPVTPANNMTLARFNSIGGGTISTMSIEQPLSPGSPSSLNNILEVTTFNPLPNTGLNNNGVSNIYQEFHLRGNAKENSIPRNNCMKKLSLDIPPQEYAPTVNSTTPTEASAFRTQINVNGNQTRSIEQLPFAYPISPTQSSDERIDTPTYMNITPSASSTPKLFGNDFKQIQTFRNNNYLVDPMHCYENLEPSELRPFLRQQQQQQQRRLSRTELISKIETVASSPIDIMGKCSEPSTPNHGKVNYIVLDLDNSHSQTSASTPNATTPSTSTEMAPSNSSNNTSPIKNIQHSTVGTVITTINSSISTSTTTHSVSSLLLPPESPQKGAFDYVTIDFHKTNALSNSITTTTECEGLRKTRHSATGTDCWPST